MQGYAGVGDYVAVARSQLQDLIAPDRYTDTDIVGALNVCVDEIARIRPDIFLDLKYQGRLKRGDIGDGFPGVYTTADIAANTLVPIPAKYFTPVHWFVAGWLQLYDVTDTQDARAQAFMVKFNTQMLTLTAA